MGALSLTLYLVTLAPGLTWAHDSADGGELAVAAHTLGIAHPPGYPTYVLLAYPVTHVPFGELAARTNLSSAVCAAGASAALAWIVARVCGGWIAAVVAGLGLAGSPMVWSQAIVTEVHALNCLMAALVLALAIAAAGRSSRNDRLTTWLGLGQGFVWGLSLGNHPTAAFNAPIVYLGLRSVGRKWVFGLAGLALGLSVYGLLPLRAAADLPVNWGNPRTLEGFWWMVSGAPYRGFVFALPLSHLPQRLLAWTQMLVRQFGAAGLLVTALGAAMLSASRRGLLAATAATSALCSAFAIGYNTSDSHLYLIPALACLGLWLGSGVNLLVGVARARSRVLEWAVVALVVAALIASAALRLPVIDLSDDRAPEAFRAAVLDPAPARAIILSNEDKHTFALWYYQHAWQARPDVDVVDLGLLGFAWYNEQTTQRIGAEMELAGIDNGGEGGLQAASERLGRPVCSIDTDRLGLQCWGS